MCRIYHSRQSTVDSHYKAQCGSISCSHLVAVVGDDTSKGRQSSSDDSIHHRSADSSARSGSSYVPVWTTIKGEEPKYEDETTERLEL